MIANRFIRALVGTLPSCIVVAGCNNSPPEPIGVKRETPVPPVGSAAVGTTSGTGSNASSDAQGAQGSKFTLEDATKDLPGKGALLATLKTSEGEIRCKLLSDKAPITVANFVGLATGKRKWKEPSGAWVNKPAYDGTTFHRIIKGFMIQGGDAKGNGSGEPGYVIPDEIWAGAKHDKPGLLCMANRGPNTNGAQFFITDEAAPHLDASYTIFGECSPVDTIHKIAAVPVDGERPKTTVKIETVKISRDK